jgi:hypothetical protein
MSASREGFSRVETTVTAPTRRVVLVALDWHRPKDPRLPLGHASLVARLAATPRVELIHGAFSVGAWSSRPAELAQRILDRTRGLRASEVDVAIGAYVWNDALLRRLLPLLRAGGFRGRIVLGGPQITYAGAGLELLYPEVDLFVRGAGEEALAALAAQPGRRNIHGVHLAGEHDRLTQAQVRLGGLPSPWLGGVCSVPDSGFVRWETTRGCAFRCAFCQHRDPGARARCQSFGRERLEEEQALLVASGAREIAILDPVFWPSPRKLRLLEAFASLGFSGRLELQAHFDHLGPRMLEACQQLDTCLEIGLQTIHPAEQAAIGRHNDLEQAARVIEALQARRIDCEISVIYGLPNQTPQSFEATVAWLLERRVPVIKAFPLVLLRGTGLERHRHRWGLLEDDAPIPRVVGSHSFDEPGWQRMHALAGALAATEGCHPRSVSEVLKDCGQQRAA